MGVSAKLPGKGRTASGKDNYEKKRSWTRSLSPAKPESRAGVIEFQRASRDKERSESLKHNRVPLSKIIQVGR